jgi:hypothetical protein
VAVAYRDLGDDEPRGRVEPNSRHRLDDLDHAGLDKHSRGTHGAVPAHRQQAGDLDEQHAEVGVGASGRLEDAARHRRVAARLVHEKRAQVVVVVDEPLAPLGHRRTREHAYAAGDHTGRHALGV